MRVTERREEGGQLEAALVRETGRAAGRDRSAGSRTGRRADDRSGESQVPGRAASAATRKPMFPVELSGVFELRAPTR